MTQNYFAVTVSARQAAIEAVEFALNEAGADGIELDLLGKPKDAETVSIVGYFAEPPDAKTISDWINDGLGIYELPADAVNSVEIKSVENKDWLAEWKKHWKPTETAGFIVAPTWSEIENANDKVVLRIEPGMAFGTGTHETTKLCLKAIEDRYRGESFFDVGTGTGVLAMAAAKIQSKLQTPKSEGSKIWACDTDADSVKIAEENAQINRVAEQIRFFIGSITAETPAFEIVAANLTADVIVPLLPLLTAKTGKTLILSGILHEQQDWVSGELAKFPMQNFAIEQAGEWISIVASKQR